MEISQEQINRIEAKLDEILRQSEKKEQPSRHELARQFFLTIKDQEIPAATASDLLIRKGIYSYRDYAKQEVIKLIREGVLKHKGLMLVVNHESLEIQEEEIK